MSRILSVLALCLILSGNAAADNAALWQSLRDGNHFALLRHALAPGTAYLSGGEFPSRVVGPGRGGRNTEFVIRLGAELADWPGRWRIASFATDGSDGASDSAGGWIDPASLRGIDVRPWLARSDSATLLAERGALFPTMATACNLMDLRIVARDL